MLSKQARQYREAQYRLAVEIAKNGGSLRLIAQEIAVKHGIKRSHQWVKYALDWARKNQQQDLSTENTLQSSDNSI
jgi:hypothetical protein